MATLNVTPASPTTVTWWISGLGSNFNTTNYMEAILSNSPAINDSTTRPSGISATMTPSGSTGGSTSTPSQTTSGGGAFSAGSTYTGYGTMRAANGKYYNAGSVTFTMPTPPVPSPLTGLTGAAVSPSQINVSWNPSTNATRYNLAVLPDPPSGTYNIFITSTSHSITGLAPATLYSILVQPYNGTVSGFGDFVNVATLGARPSNFSWSFAGYHPITNVLTLGSDKLSGYGFYISAGEWSELTSRINAFRVYKGLGATTFTSVSFGTNFTATLFNQIITGMSGLSPYFTGGNTLPSTKSSGSNISASDLNMFKNCMNSIS